MGFIFVGSNGPVVSNSTTEKTLLPATNGTLVIPASQAVPGTFVRIGLRGVYGTDAVVPTLRLRAKLIGGSTVTVGDTGANTMTGAATSDFELTVWLRFDTVGVTGVVYARGVVVIGLTQLTHVRWHMGQGSQFTIDSTVDQTIDITAQWGTANANSSIVAQDITVEISSS